MFPSGNICSEGCWRQLSTNISRSWCFRHHFYLIKRRQEVPLPGLLPLDVITVSDFLSETLNGACHGSTIKSLRWNIWMDHNNDPQIHTLNSENHCSHWKQPQNPSRCAERHHCIGTNNKTNIPRVGVYFRGRALAYQVWDHELNLQ
jgi:hypothetical protein